MFPAWAVVHNAHFVPIFFSAGWVNASAGVLLLIVSYHWCGTHQINKPIEYRKMLMLLIYRSLNFILFTGQEMLHKTHIAVDKTRKYYLNMLQTWDCAVYSNNYLKAFKRNFFACLQDETNSLRLFILAISGLNIMKYFSHIGTNYTSSMPDYMVLLVSMFAINTIVNIVWM